jgi:hypothetical protein
MFPNGPAADREKTMLICLIDASEVVCKRCSMLSIWLLSISV